MEATANRVAAIASRVSPLLPASFVPAGSDVPRPAAAGFKLPEAALAPGCESADASSAHRLRCWLAAGRGLRRVARGGQGAARSRSPWPGSDREGGGVCGQIKSAGTQSLPALDLSLLFRDLISCLVPCLAPQGPLSFRSLLSALQWVLSSPYNRHREAKVFR